MERYIAFVWSSHRAENVALANSLDRRLRSLLPHWQRPFDAPGLRVYAPADTSRFYRLDSNCGLILGNLFCRDISSDDVSGNPVFTKRTTETLQRSECRQLIDNYWGRYVAFVKEERGPRVWVLRDPTGGVPCFYSAYSGIRIVYSAVDECASLEFLTSHINWDHIAAYLWFDRLVTRHTGLSGVQQLQAGECLTIGPDSISTAYYWSPERVHSVRSVESRRQAGEELERTIQHCTTAWASRYRNILLELSGGLDSAVVLASLLRPPSSSRILCENHFTSQAEGDERVLARQAAQMANVELIETPIPISERRFEHRLDSAKCASPAHVIFLPETLLARERIVKAHQINAVFSGRGGDHLFQRGKTTEIAAEYAWRKGLRREILEIISDTARFTKKSIWTVVWAVLHSGIFRRHEDPYRHTKPPQLVTDAVLGAFDSRLIRHPWVDTSADLPGSKRQLIFHIVDSQMFYRRADYYADIVHPLISQPIIEVCLQIPSYVMTYGGIDRALVRETFAGQIPSAISARTAKGATTGYFNEMLIRSLPFFRELLLDGNLVAQGILDKQRTEAALTESCIVREFDLLFDILNAARAEFWLSTWKSAGQRAAA